MWAVQQSERNIIAYRQSLRFESPTGRRNGELQFNLGNELSKIGRQTENRARAGYSPEQYFKDSVDAYRAAIAEPAYATGWNAGQLQSLLASSLYRIGNLTKNPALAQQYFKDSVDANRAALAEPAYATGIKSTVGHLQHTIGESLFSLGKLTKNPDHFEQSVLAYRAALAEQAYADEYTKGILEDNLGVALLNLGSLTNNSTHLKESRNACRSALKNPKWAFRGEVGGHVGGLENNLGTSLLRLGDLNIIDKPADAERYYKESSEAFQRALKEPDYKTGANAGWVRDNLGFSLLRLGNLNITDNPANAKQYFKESSDVLRRALKEPAYATGKTAKRLEANLQESNEALHLAQIEITKSRKVGGGVRSQTLSSRTWSFARRCIHRQPGPATCAIF